MERLKKVLAEKESLITPTEPNELLAGFLSELFPNEIKYVDLENDHHFKNSGDTLVFEMPAGAIGVGPFFNFLKTAKNEAGVPDEVHVRVVEGKKIVRLWWD